MAWTTTGPVGGVDDTDLVEISGTVWLRSAWWALRPGLRHHRDQRLAEEAGERAVILLSDLGE
jgi:hypothetical protein